MTGFNLRLGILNCSVAVRCADELSCRFLRECYSAFLSAPDKRIRVDLAYDVTPARSSDGWTIRSAQTLINCRSSYELLYEFEKDMTQRVQLLRPDLFFVHGAALSAGDRCVVISGASGSGKSSLAWFMSYNGFEYLSDELAPVDPDSHRIQPYPHALCLKNPPLSEPELPESALHTEATIHVPAYELSARAPDRPGALALLVYIDGTGDGAAMQLHELEHAESAARLYANGLNQLAHANSGLAVVAEISRNVASYLVSGGSVEQRARGIQRLLEATGRP